MPVSGNINETIQFPEDGAGSIKGVKFGVGVADFSVVNPSLVDAVVPPAATWGKVVFQKRDRTEAFSVSATGEGDGGAYSALTGEIDSLGYYDVSSGCATGEVAFTSYYTGSGICMVSATGSSVSAASGVMVDAHGSGFCGGPNEFTTDAYTTSETRLSGTSVSKVGTSSNFVAVGLVEYTGNFTTRKASAEVACSLTGIQSTTDYKFVPIPRVSYFSFAPSGGGEITISGNCFSGVSGVSIGQEQDLTFSVSDNETILGQVPTGIFDDYIYIYAQSGITIPSVDKYITSGDVSGFVEIPSLFISPEKKRAVKGSTDSALVNGSGFIDLTGVYFLNFESQRVDVTGDSGFSYTSGQLYLPISGLTTGKHDLFVSTTGEAVSREDLIEILDSPRVSYSYKTVFTSGFDHTSEHNTESALASFLLGRDFGFEVAEKHDRISLSLSDGRITNGAVTFDLKKKASHNRTVNSSYDIVGTAITKQGSVDDAYDKWNNNIYTTDQWGMPYSEGTSYALNHRICGISSSGIETLSESVSFTSTGLHTGEVVGNPESLPMVIYLHLNDDSQYLSYVGSQNLSCSIGSESLSSGVVGVTDGGESIDVSVTGYDPLVNMNHIMGMLDSTGVYDGYLLVSTATGITDNYETYYYKSGITFPYSTDFLNNMSNPIWSDLFASGLNDLYPEGWTGQHSLTSGFSVETGVPTFTGTLTRSGLSVNAVTTSVSQEIADSYSKCVTGDPTYFVSGEIINLYETGYFYGYC